MGNSPEPSIDVLLITFNHENYVRRAIESIFAQKHDGALRVVVADDGSSDKTVDIVRQLASGRPDIPFVFLDCGTNHGITRNYKRGFSACSAEYVAVLEGDDYWVSPFKLQRQRDFLDDHLECDLCSVNYFVYEEGRGQFTPRTTPGEGHLLLGARELIADNLIGNFSTCLYRRKALDRLPAALFATTSYDWIINICVARTALIGFLKEPMSVYRIHGAGAWSLLSHAEKLQAQLRMIPEYDALTDRVYSHEFAVLASRISSVIADIQSNDVVVPAERGELELPPIESPILGWVPPLLLWAGKQLLPPTMKRRLAKLVFRI